MKRNEQALRDQQIAVERGLGDSENAVAERHGMTTRTVRRAVRRAELNRSPVFDDPVDLTLDHVASLEKAISDLALVRMRHGVSPKTEVAAIRQQLQAMSQRREFLIAIGIIPTNRASSAEHRALYAGQIAHWMRDAARNWGMDSDAEEWISAAINDWLENGPQEPLGPKPDRSTHKHVPQEQQDEAE